jgi:MFS family permease
VYYWPAVQSAWMPGGREYVGTADWLLGVTWQIFAGVLLGLLAWFSDRRARVRFLGLGVLGLIVCTPALGVARSFGVTLPALAFLTAIAIAIVSAYERVCGGSAYAGSALRTGGSTGAEPALRGRAWRGAIAGILLLGLTIGVIGGVRRSFYVAEAMHENSVTRVLRDGRFVFDGYPVRLTIPAKRRQAKLARLATFGIRSREDLERLESLVANDTSPYRRNRAAKAPLFLEKYDYVSF